MKSESFLSVEVNMTESVREKKMQSVRNRQTQLPKLNTPIALSENDKEKRLMTFLTKHNLDQPFETFKK